MNRGNIDTLDKFLVFLSENKHKSDEIYVLPWDDHQPIEILFKDKRGSRRCTDPLGFVAFLLCGEVIIPTNDIKALRKVVGLSKTDAHRLYDACEAVDGEKEGKYYNRYHSYDANLRNRVLDALGVKAEKV